MFNLVCRLRREMTRLASDHKCCTRSLGCHICSRSRGRIQIMTNTTLLRWEDGSGVASRRSDMSKSAYSNLTSLFTLEVRRVIHSTRMLRAFFGLKYLPRMSAVALGRHGQNVAVSICPCVRTYRNKHPSCGNRSDVEASRN